MSSENRSHVARQRPISCRFCRSRKLRCSRQAPCSNCVSRGLRCELETQNELESSSNSEPELLERIKKLEKLLENKNFQYESSEYQPPPQILGNPEREEPIPDISSQAGRLDKDFVWLESIFTGQDPAQDNTTANRIVFRICPINQITQSQPYINQSTTFPPTFAPLRCVWLPQYVEAKLLLEKFIADVDHVHHIIHTPSIQGILDEVYESLHHQSCIKPGKLLLLLGIFLNSTYCWEQSDCDRGLFTTCLEANKQSRLWLKTLEDVLDISHRTATISVEGIQGLSISLFVLINMEGFSRRCKSVFNMTLFLARELKLHLLDHPTNEKAENLFEKEIGRRVWWFLVASDWSLPTRFNGAVYVYQCNPRHMLVRKPMNLNDEDIINSLSPIEQPMSQPTSMTFSLLRIRLAEISRSMADRNPLIMQQTSGPNHDVIMEIDTELQMFLNDIPSFLRMSTEDLNTKYGLSPRLAKDIHHQGYMIHPYVYAQRCRLHFPYFNGGSGISTFASSREICLRSARQVIQSEVEFGTESIGTYSTIRFKYLGILASIFMASIVILMDLCQNKSSSQHEKQREELAAAIRMLEVARHDSDAAAKFLDSLKLVSRKHKVSPGQCPVQRSDYSNEQFFTPSRSDALQSNDGAMPPFLISSERGIGDKQPSSIDMADSYGDNWPSYFNELAQTFEQGIDVGNMEWNNLFWGMDSSLV